MYSCVRWMHPKRFIVSTLANYLLYYTIGDYRLWPTVYYLIWTRTNACVPHGMGSNQSFCYRKWWKTKGHFIPYPFLDVHRCIVESLPLFWHRMPYGSFIVCMFWIRWRCQLTCAICRCSSWLDSNLWQFCQRISCHIWWEKTVLYAYRGEYYDTA